jgi:hypothetical protein
MVFADAPSLPDGLDGSPCRVDGELGMALRATASLSISWGGLMLLLTADVSIVMVGLRMKHVSKAAGGGTYVE